MKQNKESAKKSAAAGKFTRKVHMAVLGRGETLQI
jgi:hypothetical protein